MLAATVLSEALQAAQHFNRLAVGRNDISRWVTQICCCHAMPCPLGATVVGSHDPGDSCKEEPRAGSGGPICSLVR